MLHKWADGCQWEPSTVSPAQTSWSVADAFAETHFSTDETQKLIRVGRVENPHPPRVENVSGSDKNLDNKNLSAFK